MPSRILKDCKSHSRTTNKGQGVAFHRSKMYSNWRTKADLKKDFGLTESDSDIDDSFIVRGDCRPPPMIDNDDEDYEKFERYRSAISDNRQRAPDYAAITEMLRQVDAYKAYNKPEPTDRNLRNNNIIIVSKLNPNCQEFVPNVAQNRVSDTGEKALSEVKNTVKESQTKDSVVGDQELRAQAKGELPLKVSEFKKGDLELPVLRIEESQTKVSELKKADLEIHEQNIGEPNKEFLAIKKKDLELRAQISEASKDNSNKGKRAKNVAICSLMKLYSSSPVTKNEFKPVLLKPEHFEKHASKFVETPLNINENVKYSELSTKITPELSEVEQQAMQESFDKVNSWLEQSDSTEKIPPSKFNADHQQAGSSTDINRTGSPAISCGSKSLIDKSNKPSPISYLTTPMFKKKESSPTVTSPRQTATNSPTKVVKSNEYVPSPYAGEYYDTLIAKQKAKKEKEAKEQLFGPHVYVSQSKKKTKGEGRKEKKKQEDSE